MGDLRQVYIDQCAKFGVKCNSGVQNTLPQSADLTTLDLSSTLVGANGVKPVLEVIKAATGLQSINLAQQRLSSEAAQEVAEVLKTHPSITSLDISGNHCPLAGPTLLELVKGNKNMVSLNINDCAVRPMFVNLITMQLDKNKGRAQTAPATTVTAAADEGDDPFAAQPFDSGADDADGGFGAATFNPPEPAQGGGGGGGMLRPGSAAAGVKRRPTVCSEVWRANEVEDFKAPVYEKPPEATKWLCERLEYVHLFSHLDDRELLTAVNAMQEQRYSMGHTLKTQGAEGDDKFFIIYSGECEADHDGSTHTLSKGDFFGELQLMYAEVEHATIKALSTEVVCYTIERNVYRIIVAKASKIKRAKYEGFLANVEFLKGMSKPDLLQLADALKSVKSLNGECIIKYGEEGQWFHLIIEGTVEVIGRDKDGKDIKVCEFKEGDCVGELEFINNHKCVADVRAVGEVRSAKMNRKHFEMCMGPVLDVLKKRAQSSKFEYYMGTQGEDKPADEAAGEAAAAEPASGGDEEDAFGGGGGFGDFSTEMPTVTAADDGGGAGAPPKRSSSGLLSAGRPAATRRRMTVSAEVITDQEATDYQPDVVEKDDKTRDMLVTALERMTLFCHLEDFELRQLAMAMMPHHYGNGDVIVSAGDDSDNFHLITQGSVLGESEDEGSMELKAGQHFGEVVLMYAQAYGMTFTAAAPEVTTYSLDRMTYKHIMQKASMKKRAMYHDFLKGVNFLKALSAAELLQLADALKPSVYKPGENLITYGDDGLWFFIIVEGTVEVFGRDKDMQEKKVCEFAVGDCVGELEFIHNHKCVADVKAKDSVRAAKMHRYHFELCMGPIVELLKRQAGESEVYEYYRETIAGQNAAVEASDYQAPAKK